MRYKAPRGTSDILPTEQKHWRFVEASAVALCRRYGFPRLDTPVFEDSGLFARSVGEGTDIVENETYTFPDRGGDSLTLRPEGTASVCRSYLEHGMNNLPQPVRLYYFCPVFRYERPQSGRYREHHQFGAEVLGDGDPSVDAEVIEMAWGFISSLGIREHSLILNSIGDRQCRPGYIQELKAYYSGHVSELCDDCRIRLERNPLRLLDCKKPGCQALGPQAPRSIDHLCENCQDHWDSVQKYLGLLKIPYRIDHHLVRGLDYYTRTVFEIQPSQEGSQSTMCGGGRYDGLIEELGGNRTPGIGFAAGMERLVLNIKRNEVEVTDEPGPKYMVASIGDNVRERAIDLAAQIRQAGVGAVLSNVSRSLRGQLRQANALGIPYLVIVGGDELQQGQLTIRDMSEGDQETKAIEEFFEELSHGRERST